MYSLRCEKICVCCCAGLCLFLCSSDWTVISWMDHRLQETVWLSFSLFLLFRSLICGPDFRCAVTSPPQNTCQICSWVISGQIRSLGCSWDHRMLCRDCCGAVGGAWILLAGFSCAPVRRKMLIIKSENPLSNENQRKTV